MSAADPTPEDRIVINGQSHPVQECDIDTLHVAIMVRMLHRDDIDHERICTLGRDRIMFLAEKVERLAAFAPTHRHYKGGLYQVLHRAEMEADGHAVVVYRNEAGRVWVRDSVEFFGTIDGGALRFVTIEQGPPK